MVTTLIAILSFVVGVLAGVAGFAVLIALMPEPKTPPAQSKGIPWQPPLPARKPAEPPRPVASETAVSRPVPPWAYLPVTNPYEGRVIEIKPEGMTNLLESPVTFSAGPAPWIPTTPEPFKPRLYDPERTA